MVDYSVVELDINSRLQRRNFNLHPFQKYFLQ